MISSISIDGAKVCHGIEIDIRRFSGARSARVIGGGETIVGEHSHDWPVLSLYVMGDYEKTFDGGEARIAGPSVVLHGAGEAHSNRLFGAGLEQIDLQFDPAWLRGRVEKNQLKEVKCWKGGEVAAAGNTLAWLWSNGELSEDKLARVTSQFIMFALAAPKPRPPVWLSEAVSRLEIGSPPTATVLAREFGLHPSWLAQAYRASVGEGMRQTLQRKRVEYATMLLRRSDTPPAQVAAAAGFCDQSHMSRAFRKLLGRTPAQVRLEGTYLGLGASPSLSSVMLT